MQFRLLRQRLCSTLTKRGGLRYTLQCRTNMNLAKNKDPLSKAASILPEELQIHDVNQKTRIRESETILKKEASQGLFRDDLTYTQRKEEDEEIIKELMGEQIQKNKWIHFQNEQMGSRWVGDWSRNTLEGLHSKPPIEELAKEPESNVAAHFNFQSLDRSFFDKPPSTYYRPNTPLPAFRNHESLFTIDPRDESQVSRSEEIESESKSMLRVNLKAEKLPQIRDGVSYSPDFDFDLWGVDVHRPRVPMDPQDWGNRWMVAKPGKAVMQRKTLPMRYPKRQDEFAPKYDRLIEFRYKARVKRDRWKPWKKPVYMVVKILGNGRGCAGFGVGKAPSMDEANQRANFEASHNMMYVPRYRNRTLGAPIDGKMNNVKVRIEPRPVGSGGHGPYLIKAVCCAFGIHDFHCRFTERRRTHITRLRAIFRAFLSATNATMVCEDRGQRMVKAFPEQDYMSYHMPRGFAHDNRVHAIMHLRKHLDKYEAAYEDKFLPRSEELERKMPQWCKQPQNFWESQDPDVFDFKTGKDKYMNQMKGFFDGNNQDINQLPYKRWERLSSNRRDAAREKHILDTLTLQRLDNVEKSTIGIETRQEKMRDWKIMNAAADDMFDNK